MMNLPKWPVTVPRLFRPLARLKHGGALNAADFLDRLCAAEAHRIKERDEAVRCSNLTGNVTELLFRNRAVCTALASFTSEASLIGGISEQPFFPGGFFDDNRGPYRVVSFWGRGVVSSTGTPTYTFQSRLGTTSGSAYLSGTSVGVSAAITTASGITNKYWEFRLDLTCITSGIGSGNTTLLGAGLVYSPGGFASPYGYALEPTTPDTATWTATIDNSVTQFFNFSVACSASSASNTIQLINLYCGGLN